MTYTKADVTRSYHQGTAGWPAVNVKLHGRQLPNPDAIQQRFGCDARTAARALDLWFDVEVEQFWAQAGTEAEWRFGTHVAVCSAGRSGGWLVVAGLPPVERWDAVLLARWRGFERTLLLDVSYRCELGQACAAIENNRWAEPGAEAYNFATLRDGRDVCLVDVKQQCCTTVPGGALVLR